MEFLKHVQKSDKIILGLVALVLFFAGFQVGSNFSLYEKGPRIEIGDRNLEDTFNLSPLSNAWESVTRDFVNFNNVDFEKLSYGLAKGMIRSLGDPYSAFLTPEETRVFNQELDQELEGIGAELNQEDGLLKVVSPLRSSPAEKAGLMPGDVIIEIDGEDALEMNLFEAVSRIRGKKGSYVTLKVVRDSERAPIEIRILRDVIEIDSITTEDLGDGIFYISINQFSNDTAKEFNDAVTEALLKSPRGLILDIRFNGGGYLQTAVDILGEFLTKGTPAVVVASGADKQKETLKTNGKTRLGDISTVVLINRGSASASEILAGALQDNEKAFVIGKPSYGKGTVQKIEQFRDGSSIRLTVAKWFTPAGRDIEENGIQPDLEVEFRDEDLENGVDTQLEIAKEYLKNLYISNR
jgi:carboxyl-terminal processing protease